MGVQEGIYEYTLATIEHLSPWNARAVLVDKVENPQATDEPRLTFDYPHVKEAHMELAQDIHDYLERPEHSLYLQIDLKHSYYSITLHPDDRHIYAFTISGFGQLQPTRLPQGCCGVAFSMSTLMNRALGAIPSPVAKPSLPIGLISTRNSIFSHIISSRELNGLACAYHLRNYVSLLPKSQL